MKCNLQEIMLQANLTVKELSQKSGLSKSTIEKYRQNKVRIIHFKTLDKLCKSLNCDCSDIFN